MPETAEGPLLASVDAQDDAVSLYAYRDGAFVLVGSLATGRLPAQIIAADLNGDGWDDLVVRNAGDGTLSLFRNNRLGGLVDRRHDPFLPPVTSPSAGRLRRPGDRHQRRRRTSTWSSPTS